MKSSLAGLFSTAALLVILGASYLPHPASAVAVLVLGVIFGFGWPRYLGIPAQKTLGAIIALSAAASAAVVLIQPRPSFALWAAPVAAAGWIAVFVVELIRGTGQPHRLESTFGAVSGVALAVAGSGWVSAAYFSDRSDILLVSCFSAIVVFLISMVPWPDAVIAPFGLVLGVLAGPFAALLFADIHVIAALLTALATSAFVLAMRRVSSTVTAGRSIVTIAASALAPALGLGMLVYMAEKIIPG